MTVLEEIIFNLPSYKLITAMGQKIIFQHGIVKAEGLSSAVLYLAWQSPSLSESVS
jgi:hypothetical protein